MLTVKEISKISGAPIERIYRRLRRGYLIVDAVNQPAGKGGKPRSTNKEITLQLKSNPDTKRAEINRKLEEIIEARKLKEEILY